MKPRSNVLKIVKYLLIYAVFISGFPYTLTAQDPNHYCYSADGVVAAAGKGTSEAGVTILKKGGNAADAAVATILALSIVDHEPFCIGGEAPLMIYDSREKKTFVYSGMGTSPGRNLMPRPFVT